MKKHLTIYFTSDTHGYFPAVDYATGKTAATGVVNCAADFVQDGNSLILDGGDTLQGSPFTYFLHEQGKPEGEICARLMNLCGYQFVTLGNHDFNYGRENLQRYLNALDARCLCANVEGLDKVEKTAVVTLVNGLRVGLTGHQHIAMENRRVFHSWTCQTPEKARAYIRLDAEVDESGVTAESRLCPAGERTLPDSAELLDSLNAETAAWLDTPVGHLDTALEPDTPLNMAKNGSLIANFFNQVQLEASGADISATCLGNEVKGFDRDVTIRDVVATYIYPNTLRTLEVDRTVLKAALERCASYFDFDDKGALCVSESFLKPKVEHYNFDFFAGLAVRMELRRPVGERVTSIRFQGEELPEGRKLRLCLNNYRAAGSGGYEFYTDCEMLDNSPTEIVELIRELGLEKLF